MSQYERWQMRYATDELVFGARPNAFLERQKKILPSRGTALALADGEGRNGLWLAEQGLDVLSLDFSPNAQAKARKLAEDRGLALRFEQADIHQWPFPDQTFDVVVEIFAQFSSPAERTKKWEGVRRALKPGGLLLVEGYTPRQLTYGTGGPKAAENLYTRELLESAFRDFAEVAIEEYDATLAEGSGHAGMSALIDFVGRK
ncbi:MAG: class I SAM-dependent methyltransferase [Hyphomicrobiales bacterium]|nr:class I SAM-dependent methyltransferase [Hyphomicrobiales bacterium]